MTSPIVKIIYTTAPVDYDYARTETLETFELGLFGAKVKTYRKVQLTRDAESQIEYQLNRYSSGFHGASEIDPRIEHADFEEAQERRKRARLEKQQELEGCFDIKLLQDQMYCECDYPTRKLIEARITALQELQRKEEIEALMQKRQNDAELEQELAHHVASAYLSIVRLEHGTKRTVITCPYLKGSKLYGYNERGDQVFMYDVLNPDDEERAWLTYKALPFAPPVDKSGRMICAYYYQHPEEGLIWSTAWSNGSLYRNDGSKIRKGSKLEKSLIYQNFNPVRDY